MDDDGPQLSCRNSEKNPETRDFSSATTRRWKNAATLCGANWKQCLPGLPHNSHFANDPHTRKTKKLVNFPQVAWGQQLFYNVKTCKLLPAMGLNIAWTTRKAASSRYNDVVQPVSLEKPPVSGVPCGNHTSVAMENPELNGSWLGEKIIYI